MSERKSTGDELQELREILMRPEPQRANALRDWSTRGQAAAREYAARWVRSLMGGGE
jgi:hypothetical protein